ncbi:MAG: hypothetical protein QOF61_3293 [Acidobacteriota bacterium]|nr:hypothetical protein [Acidobacteriota bacterium]
MRRRMSRAGFACAALSCLALAVPAGVKVTVEHNTGGAASGDFKFKHVPPPAKDDAAAHARVALVLGQRDANGASLSALTDGALPASEDEPRANFFFNAGTDGGRFRLDLGAVIEIVEVNSYSWHANSRAPQVYNLYASDGTDAKFNDAPDANTDPRSCGWTFIATVDTRAERGEAGGQYGASVADAGGTLGKYRYLLFDVVPSEYEDPWGNTFYSEVDVLAKK